MPIWGRSRKRPVESPARENSADATVSRAELEALLLRASEESDPVAQVDLGRRFLAIGREFDAMNFWRHAAYQGHEPAWLEIGALCGKDHGVPGTHEDVAQWYAPAAAAGSAIAQLALAGLYREGLGVDPDPVECTRLYRLAAEQGDPTAQFWLSHRFLQGVGVEQDVKKSFKWMERAAKGGDLNAQVQLGSRHIFGIGVRANAAKGIEWLTKPASEGDLDAISMLVCLYLGGGGCTENLEQAAEWLRKFISRTDYGFAVEHARRLLTLTKRLLPYPVLAHILLSLVSESGDRSAKRECKRLERTLSAREIGQSREVRKLCRPAVRSEWKPRQRRKRRQ